jgi:transcriptional regulator with XRE-family HTH domain
VAGVGSALKQYMAELGLNLQTLADQSKTPRSTIADILNNPKVHPRINTLERISEALSRISGRHITVTDLARGVESGSNQERLDWLWEARFSQIALDELIEMRGWPVEKRLAWCVRQIITAIGPTETAERLGYSAEDIQQIIAGVAPQPNLLSALEKRAQVPANYLMNGDPGSTDLSLRTFLQSDDAGTWLAFIKEAKKAGIPPEWMIRYLRSLIELRNLN